MRVVGRRFRHKAERRLGCQLTREVRPLRQAVKQGTHLGTFVTPLQKWPVHEDSVSATKGYSITHASFEASTQPTASVYTPPYARGSRIASRR
jgi:hypothetical protein